MKMTNRWNRFIYRLWAPIYDSTVNHIFMPGRRRALEVLALHPGERVLLVGVGTGADFPLLSEGLDVTGIDLSRDMLARARLKLPLSLCTVTLIEGDAQALLVEESGFEAVVLNLILSVIPDGNACLRSAWQALRPGGRAVIFDKFLPEGEKVTLARRFINLFSTLLGTDINRRLSDLMEGLPWVVVQDEPSIAGGIYRVILLQKI
jgi:phosphatidylethanolamine/phosphatidyl-N-methylethanolamine N-methyltransferase